MCQFGGVYWNIEEINLKDHAENSNILEDYTEKTHNIISQQEKNT